MLMYTCFVLQISGVCEVLTLRLPLVARLFIYQYAIIVIKQCFFPRLAAVVAHLIIFVLFRAGAAKVVSKMASQFATVREEQILALNEGAVTENTKKATNLACCFYSYGFS